jgi:hypothetical protein
MDAPSAPSSRSETPMALATAKTPKMFPDGKNSSLHHQLNSFLSYLLPVINTIFDQQYNRLSVSVSKPDVKLIPFNGLVANFDVSLNFIWQSVIFFCCHTKKTMFYVLQLRPKLDYTYFKLKLDFHFNA